MHLDKFMSECLISCLVLDSCFSFCKRGVQVCNSLIVGIVQVSFRAFVSVSFLSVLNVIARVNCEC